MRIIALSALLALASATAPAQDAGVGPRATPKAPPNLSKGFSLHKATVEKVYAAERNGSRYRAYQVQWEGSAVVVPDLFAITKHQVGDEIQFLAQNLELEVRGETLELLQFKLMEFGSPPPATRAEPAPPSAAPAAPPRAAGATGGRD